MTTTIQEIIEREIEKQISYELKAIVRDEILSIFANKRNTKLLLNLFKEALKEYAKETSVLTILFKRAFENKIGDFLNKEIQNTLTIKIKNK